MARKSKVVCQVTKEYGTSDVFYKAPDGKYYKTKEIYIKDRENKEYYKLCIDKLANFLGYCRGKVFPTIVSKKIAELKEGYSCKVIYNTIEKCEDSIVWALQNKEFNNDNGRMSYILAIISNHINDMENNDDIAKKIALKEKSILSNEDVDVSYDNKVVHKAKNISDLLGDDLWI